jgi:DNA-binding beta-propeller fold protein YncE
MRTKIFIVSVLALSVLFYLGFDPASKLMKTHSPDGKNIAYAEGETGPSFPSRIAFTPEGNLLVTDYNLGAVYILSKKDLSVINKFSVEGLPLAVAWGRGYIYVGNEQTRTIEVYNRGGKLIRTFNDTNGPSFEIIALDMAVDPVAGYLYVVDNLGGNVKVFEMDGKLAGTIPSSNGGEGFSRPTAIALDTERWQVIVSDYGDDVTRELASVKVYSLDGQFLFKFVSDWLARSYRFSRPQGVAVDSKGDIYMVDAMLGHVIVVDRNSLQGKAILGGYGTAEGKLKLPLDLVIDKGGNVYVTDNRNGRVEVFKR